MRIYFDASRSIHVPKYLFAFMNFMGNTAFILRDILCVYTDRSQIFTLAGDF